MISPVSLVEGKLFINNFGGFSSTTEVHVAKRSLFHQLFGVRVGQENGLHRHRAGLFEHVLGVEFFIDNPSRKPKTAGRALNPKP